MIEEKQDQFQIERPKPHISPELPATVTVEIPLLYGDPRKPAGTHLIEISGRPKDFPLTGRLKIKDTITKLKAMDTIRDQPQYKARLEALAFLVGGTDLAAIWYAFLNSQEHLPKKLVSYIWPTPERKREEIEHMAVCLGLGTVTRKERKCLENVLPGPGSPVVVYFELVKRPLLENMTEFLDTAKRAAEYLPSPKELEDARHFGTSASERNLELTKQLSRLKRQFSTSPAPYDRKSLLSCLFDALLGAHFISQVHRLAYEEGEHQKDKEHFFRQAQEALIQAFQEGPGTIVPFIEQIIAPAHPAKAKKV